MLTINESIKGDFNLEKKILQQINEGLDKKGCYNSLWFSTIGIWVYEYFINHNINLTKQRLYLLGRLAEVLVTQCNSDYLNYSLNHTFPVILSDNEALIQRYAKLRYTKSAHYPFDMEEQLLIGNGVFCNTVQHFMVNNKDGIEKNLNIIETKVINKKKNAVLIHDYDFYKALYEGNMPKMEEVIHRFSKGQLHKNRQYNQLLGKYVAPCALGYAKLAWRLGYKVETNSPLIPKELLPIEPIKQYDEVYDFLKEDYQNILANE
jgi:hypothetical protein